MPKSCLSSLVHPSPWAGGRALVLNAFSPSASSNRGSCPIKALPALGVGHVTSLYACTYPCPIPGFKYQPKVLSEGLGPSPEWSYVLPCHDLSSLEISSLHANKPEISTLSSWAPSVSSQEQVISRRCGTCSSICHSSSPILQQQGWKRRPKIMGTYGLNILLFPIHSALHCPTGFLGKMDFPT